MLSFGFFMLTLEVVVGQLTPEEIKDTNKRFCKGNETLVFLRSTEIGSVVHKNRCGFNIFGKAKCIHCFSCADGYEREGKTCGRGTTTTTTTVTYAIVASDEFPILALVLAACATLVALPLGLLAAKKLKEKKFAGAEEEEGEEGRMRQVYARRGGVSASRGSHSSLHNSYRRSGSGKLI